jgi:predicted nucleic acid-binding protein
VICIDASVIISLLLPEELSNRAGDLVQQWRADGEELVAPQWLMAEVPSALRRAVYTGRTSAAEAEEALESFLQMPVRLIEFAPLLRDAWRWGIALNTPRIYDMFYLALADQFDCDLWVVEKKLVNIVGARSGRVRWVGDVEDGSNP